MPDGEQGTRRRNTDETTRKLLDAAAATFVEHGYDKAVVSDVARRAGLTTGSIFARWPNKNEMMAAAVDHIFSQILPDQRLKQLGIEEWPAINIFLAWGDSLLQGDEAQDVMVQAFASARNNEAVQQRFKLYLHEQAEQISRLVERTAAEANADAEVNVAAVTLAIQAVGIGTHLLLSVGRDDIHTPSESEWSQMVEQFFAATLNLPQPIAEPNPPNSS